MGIEPFLTEWIIWHLFQFVGDLYACDPLNSIWTRKILYGIELSTSTQFQLRDVLFSFRQVVWVLGTQAQVKLKSIYINYFD